MFKKLLAAIIPTLLFSNEVLAQTFHVDPQHSTVHFEVQHAGISTTIGLFVDFEAEIIFDRENPANSSLNAFVAGESAESHSPLRDEWIVDAVLKSNEYDGILFSSTSIEVTSDNTGKIFGDLSIRGVTIPNFVFETTLVDEGDILGISARAEILRSAFGSVDYPGIVGDKVIIRIEGEANLLE